MFKNSCLFKGLAFTNLVDLESYHVFFPTPTLIRFLSEGNYHSRLFFRLFGAWIFQSELELKKI